MTGERERISRISLVMTILYACMIIYFVLFSDRLGRGEGFSEYRYNLTPFEEIRRFIVYRDNVTPAALALNLAGNLAVFFPLGFLIPIWRKKETSDLWIICISFAFSLFIETTQLIFKVGVFDVDDLMMNTLGGLAGCILYRIAIAIYRYFKKKRTRGGKK